MGSQHDLKYNNIYPLIGVSLTLIINIGALFWWGGRISLSQDQMLSNQSEMKAVWYQLEKRVGVNELDIRELKTVVSRQ